MTSGSTEKIQVGRGVMTKVIRLSRDEPRARGRLLWAALLIAAVALSNAVPAAAAEPQLSVPRAKLTAAFHCTTKIRNASKEPILLSTGTGAAGSELYASLKPALDAYRHPSCYVDYPDYTTADVQVSVQYLVFAIRREAQLAGRPLAIYGISQGALLPRIALTYWPSLRSKVTDVIAAAGTQHGTTVQIGSGCSQTQPCPPAVWQQARGSNFLSAFNPQPDESPGATGWTTVRSLGDEVVQPQSGPHPTSALRGAANIVIQNVCPGRQQNHIGTAYDSVTWAALLDAVAHKGAAKASRLPANVCSHKYASGLDEQQTNAGIAAAYGLIINRLFNQVPKVPREPRVRAWVK
jgi:hypothetical protein